MSPAHSAEISDSSKSILKESRLRSILKAFSWRIVATLTTVILTWSFTGEVDTALKVGTFEFFLKFAIYYLHERAWQMVPRGTIRELVSIKH